MSPSLLEKIAAFRRDAWIPHTVETTPKFDASDKFGGLPYLRNADDWPRCSNCGKHMQLFVQLDLSRLPAKQGKNLAQFFYCTSTEPLCENDCEAYYPNQTSTKLRLVEVNGPSAVTEPDLKEIFPEQSITNWERQDDYPNWEELEELGVKLSDEEAEELSEADYPLSGDKLFGWPYWVQGVEYHLPDSELFVQIDTECNVPFMWGDSGCGHITRAVQDDSKMVFGWACC